MTEAPGAGHNLPPIGATHDDLLLRYQDLTSRRDELLDHAGSVPEITDDDVAGKVSDLIKMITACVKNSEAARVKEKEPYLEGGRQIDGWFAKVKDPLMKAKKAIEADYTHYLRQKEEAERRRREEEERKAREEAERKRQEAEALAQAAQDEADLNKALDAEAGAALAEDEMLAAEKAADAKAAELSRTRGDLGAVGSLRTTWVGEMTDRQALDLEALRHLFTSDCINKAISAYVKAGGRELRGAKIYEKKSAVVR